MSLHHFKSNKTNLAVPDSSGIIDDALEWRKLTWEAAAIAWKKFLGLKPKECDV